MVITYNGMLAAELGEVRWQKSWHSNPNGECVELAALPTGEIAMRNSRFPAGPVLLYTQAEITAFLAGAEDRSLAHWYLVTCESAERSRHLLNCHRSPFRKREITWETGPHPAWI